MKFSHSATIFGLIQVVLIVSGFVMTAALMKAHGYPDQGRPFPPAADFVRKFVILLMLIPLAYAILASLDTSQWPIPEFGLPLHVFTGIAIIVLLFILMIHAIVAAYLGPAFPIQGTDGFP